MRGTFAVARHLRNDNLIARVAGEERGDGEDAAEEGAATRLAACSARWQVASNGTAGSNARR